MILLEIKNIIVKIDKITQERIQKLHPKVRDEVKKIIEEANSLLADNVEIRVVQGLRTIEEQNAVILDTGL